MVKHRKEFNKMIMKEYAELLWIHKFNYFLEQWRKRMGEAELILREASKCVKLCQ